MTAAEPCCRGGGERDPDPGLVAGSFLQQETWMKGAGAWDVFKDKESLGCSLQGLGVLL